MLFSKILYTESLTKLWHASLLELPNRPNTGVFTLNGLLWVILVLDSSGVSVFGL